MNKTLSPIKIAIVEDKKMLMAQLRESLEQYPDILIVSVFESCDSFLVELQTLPVDVVIMDIHLPGMTGVECVKKVKNQRPEIQVVMWTVFDDDDHIFSAILNGATGYILKNSPVDQIVSNIHEVNNGGSPMSTSVARKLLNIVKSGHSPSPYLDLLSKREREILKLLADGYRYKNVAEKLFISIETVRTHIRNIYSKLHVQSRAEAINKIFPGHSNF